METVTVSGTRSPNPFQQFLRVLMIVLAALFLLGGIAFSRGLMLPCFLTALLALWYGYAVRRAYEYVLEAGKLLLYRVSDHGRHLLHEIAVQDIEIISRPDDPAVAPYRKGGERTLPKFDYTSYREDVPYYTAIVRENGQRIKLLLDLTPEAIAALQRSCPAALRSLSS